jgi:2-C-methyl-D-erythritol 2,4-cyclodiphosphate synthase
MPDCRTGIGYDIHRLVPDRPLILGGMRVPSELGLMGHSDADVVLHALTDALLGAVAAPDIGELFPDDDPRWSGAHSQKFLQEALERVRAAGYAIGNLDLVIHAQQPRLSAHKQAIRQSVAQLCGLTPDRIGLKATTNEGLDAIGQGQAIACWANVLLTRA